MYFPGAMAGTHDDTCSFHACVDLHEFSMKTKFNYSYKWPSGCLLEDDVWNIQREVRWDLILFFDVYTL